MSKELTEQWRSGMLEEAYYYVKLPDNDIPIVNFYQLKQLTLVNDADEIEILTPVPTYQEHLESEAHCAVYSEINEWNKEKIEELNAKCSQLEKKVKKRGMQINRAYDRYIAKRKESSEMVAKCNRLEEQLKEANEVIKFYANIDKLTEEEKQMTAEKYHLVYGLKANDYLEKWRLR